MKSLPCLLAAAFDPETAPIMIAPKHIIIKKPSGIANLFLRYQGVLLNVMKRFVKNTFS